ncbi:MAG: hypothetical protein V1667_04085, partial [bacterium]
FLLRLLNFRIIFSKFSRLYSRISSKIYKKFCWKFKSLVAKAAYQTGSKGKRLKNSRRKKRGSTNKINFYLKLVWISRLKAAMSRFVG